MELDTKEKAADQSRITNKTLNQVLHQLEIEDVLQKNETPSQPYVQKKSPISGQKKFGEKTEEFRFAAAKA
jgi:DNA-binding HxlR family transcriptional regulator